MTFLRDEHPSAWFESGHETVRVCQQVLAEYLYRAAREVRGGSPVDEVAKRFGWTRQSLHAGVSGSRPRHAGPGRPLGTAEEQSVAVDAGIEAPICRLGLEVPLWGACRIAFEHGPRGIASVPGHATVHQQVEKVEVGVAPVL